MTQPITKPSGQLVEFLDHGRLRPGLIVREQGERVAVLGADGREKLISRDLVLVRHSGRNIDASNLPAAIAELEGERARMAGDLDLSCYGKWSGTRAAAISADELAELFFGHRSAIGTTVVLDACLTMASYFIRRHLEFVPNPPTGSIESAFSRNASG